MVGWLEAQSERKLVSLDQVTCLLYKQYQAKSSGWIENDLQGKMGFTDSVPFSSKRAQSDKPTQYHYDHDEVDEVDDSDDDDDDDDEEYLANILAAL